MSYKDKELCRNLGELVMMKVAGELDDEQYAACTEYMLKEAGVVDGGLNWLRNLDYLGAINRARGLVDGGFSSLESGAKRLRGLSDDVAAAAKNSEQLVNQGKDVARAFGLGTKEKSAFPLKALGVGAAGGIGAYGLSNLLSAAGNARAYDPYEY